jgi:nucleoside-diphosphate-sugar epimerase
MSGINTYAILGSTGNCGTALIQNLLKRPDVRINAYCRNRSKLLRLLPNLEDNKRVEIFEGNIQDLELLTTCVSSCRAIFLCVTTNDNVPGCHMARDTAATVVQALQRLRNDQEEGDGARPMPKLVLLSSGTIDEQFSRDMFSVLYWILLRSASYVYQDLIDTEQLLRAQEDWLKTIYIKPGALAVDSQQGHALSLTDQDGPLSYLDLAAGMIEAVEDPQGRYDLRNVCVNPVNGKASFPPGTPLCILTGLLRHYFPWLHPYLPLGTGPR